MPIPVCPQSGRMRYPVAPRVRAVTQVVSNCASCRSIEVDTYATRPYPDPIVTWYGRLRMLMLSWLLVAAPPPSGAQIALDALARQPTLSIFAGAELTADAQPSTGVADPRIDAAIADTDPVSFDDVALHYATGVAASMFALGGSYALATAVGQQGNGLGPGIAGLLIGALVPPLVISFAQWAAWEAVYPGRDRYWPGYVVGALAHVGVFVAAVLGGVSFQNSGEVIALIIGESVVLPALTTGSTVFMRRRVPSASSVPAAIAIAPPDPLAPAAVIAPLVRVQF